MKDSINKLSYKKIHKITNKIWKEQINNEDNKVRKDALKYRKFHSDITAKVSKKLYKYNTISDDKEKYRKILYFACLVHDIKKHEKKHHVAGASYIKEYNKDKFSSNMKLKKGQVKMISHLIKNHRIGTKYEGTNQVLKHLVLIIRAADSLSGLYPYHKKKKAKFKNIKKKIERENSDYFCIDGFMVKGNMLKNISI